MRRLATTDLSGNMSLFHEVKISDAKLTDLLVDAQTRKVVAHYAHGAERSSELVFFDIGAGDVRRQVKLPVRVRAPFLEPSGTLSMILRESQESVGSLTTDGTIRRRGRLGSGALMGVVPWQSHRFVNVFKSSATLSVLGSNGLKRVVATAEFFGPVSVARDGQAVFEQLIPGGRMVVNHYDPTSLQIRALTSGGRELSPIIQPDGSGFFYIDGNAQRSLTFCALPNNSKCDSLPGTGVVGLLGVSPSGRRLALSMRDGPRSRLRVLSLQDGSTQDFGPIMYHCPVRWDSEDRFWAFSQSEEFTGWTGFDVRHARPTGNKEPMDIAKGTICPHPEAGPHMLKRESSIEAELWRLPVED